MSERDVPRGAFDARYFDSDSFNTFIETAKMSTASAMAGTIALRDSFSQGNVEGNVTPVMIEMLDNIFQEMQTSNQALANIESNTELTATNTEPASTGEKIMEWSLRTVIIETMKILFGAFLFWMAVTLGFLNI